LLLPQIPKLADRSDVISEVQKGSKIQIFRGSALHPAGGAYSAPLEPVDDEEGARCALSRTPPPLSGLLASFLRVSASKPLQSWQPYTLVMVNFKCRPMKFAFCSVLENGENGLGDEGADGGSAARILG